jgi:hypothetical protein
MITSSLKGRVRVAVRQDGQIIKDYGWQDNLILDQGLDKLATMPFNQVFTACCCGTGSNPTGRNPNTTATVAGTVLTAAAATFSSSDLDADCVFASLGLRFKIQSVTDPSHVTLFTTGSVPTATAFTIEYTNQAILEGEVKRSAIYLDTPGGNGYLINPGSVVLWRTFLFTPETTEITYTEIGFSDSSAAGPNLFSRVVLATPVSLIGPSAVLPSGQQLQVTYQLTVGIDYGNGPGNFFSGRTTATISVTNLPIQFSIWQSVDSTTLPGNVAVTMAGNVPAIVGESVVVAGSSVAGYNGTWQVLDSTQITDTTHGVSTTLSLKVPWSAAATGGTLTIPLTGEFFRGNQGIWLIGTVGQQIPPPDAADAFLAYGEPSVAGQAWASSVGGQQLLGSNNAPSRIDPTLLSSVNCVLQSYTPGSFHLDRVADIVIGNSPNVYAFGYGIADLTNQIETWTWDQPHALLIGSTLALTIRVSWGRTPQ